jgi:hypothetical protein
MDASPNDRGAIARAHIAALCEQLGACAAGYWQLDSPGQRLVQVAFVPGAGLDPQVGHQFAAATLDVALSQKNLGIVTAAIERRPVVSHASDLPEDSGSGRWLRAFGAGRSVAVPILDKNGQVEGVLSVALPPEIALEDQEVAEQIQSTTDSVGQRSATHQ